jgi:hypothetical protein
MAKSTATVTVTTPATTNKGHDESPLANPILPLDWGTLTVDKIVVAAIETPVTPANKKGYELKRVSLGSLVIPAPYPFDSLTLAGQLVPVIVGSPTEDNPVPANDVSLYHYGDSRLDACYCALVDELKANALKGIVNGTGTKEKPVIYATVEEAVASITFDTKGALPDSWEALGATSTKLTGAMQRKAYEAALAAWLEANPVSKAVGGAVTALRVNLGSLVSGMRSDEDLAAFLRWPARKDKSDAQIGNLAKWMLDDEGLQGLLDILANTADSGASALVHRTISSAIALAMAPKDEVIPEDDSEF